MVEYLYGDEVRVKSTFKDWLMAIAVGMLVVALFASLLFVFSYRSAVKEGTVTHKHFITAYKEELQHQVIRYYPNVYAIIVSDRDWLGRKINSLYYVTVDTYDSLEIGDSWKWEDGLYYLEPPKY